MNTYKAWSAVLLLALAAPALAGPSTEVLLAGRATVAEGLVIGRDTSVHYTLNPGLSFLLQNDSIDDFWYGWNTRWGLSVLVPVWRGSVDLEAGGGLSVSGSAVAGGQVSLDLVLRGRYGIAFLDLDTLLFRDGLLGDALAGIQWRIFHGPPEIALRLGAGGWLTAGAGGAGFYPSLIVGTAVAF